VARSLKQSPKHEIAYCLAMIASLEAKQSSKQPPFIVIIAYSLMGYAIWGSKECVPSVPEPL